MIQNPLALGLLNGQMVSGQTIKATADGEEIKFVTDEAAAASQQGG
jgi:hypothetical protein